MNEELYIQFDPEKCTACYACVVACKSWRDMPLGVSMRRVEVHWQGDFPEVERIHMSMNCQHCIDPVCIPHCPATAITKRESDGVVLVNYERCIGCQKCYHYCPYKVPQFDHRGKMRKCDLCQDPSVATADETPPCVNTCPTQALTFKKITPQEKLQAMEKHLKLMDQRSY